MDKVKLSQSQKKAMLMAKTRGSITLLEVDYRTVDALVRKGYFYETEILRDQVEEYRLSKAGEQLVSLWNGLDLSPREASVTISARW